MKNTKVVEMNKTTKANNTGMETAYYSIFTNMKPVGSKNFVCIPIEMLTFDESYQRIDTSSASKIKTLADKWDSRKMTPLLVAPHPETHNFCVIDGYHRYSAAKIMKERGKEIVGLECDVVLGLSKDPRERRIQEAKLFVTQDNEADKLTPMQKHKANLLCDIPENVALQKVVDKYDVMLKKPTGRGVAKAGHLSGFTAALAIAKVDGQKILDDVFYVITNSRWNLCRSGFNSCYLRSIRMVLKLHPENISEIQKEMIRYFTPIQPEQFSAESKAAYPGRKEIDGVTMHLEDIVCDALGLEKVYQKEAEKKMVAKKKTA